MRKAIVVPTVLIVTLLILILIGTYLSSTSTYISKEYYKDLAELRGYWGAYGAKELNVSSNISYNYSNYYIDVNRTGNYTWEWNLRPTGGVISQNDVHNRELILAEDNISIKYYKQP